MMFKAVKFLFTSTKFKTMLLHSKTSIESSKFHYEGTMVRVILLTHAMSNVGSLYSYFFHAVALISL